ncbi:MAG: formate--tetrahydrofolate ligase [Omnitrophica WOR_2 bacterium RIFCSPHIGHO2_02_FULL_46_37]|nr:MAG: formate--tetrahydrofolate ligase [Omnitrophica WOR_2 bacterium RIFCSPHIGHO2_02_FULL_46_37]
MLSNLEIARKIKPEQITKIAKSIGIKEKELELYGNYKAKIDLSILKRIKDRPLGKYILVTAITPTPLGEGKTVTTIGLSMALNRIGKKTIACIRQPSLGPVFGIKGGAAGGGYSQVIPMEDFNLHFTGDVHAVGLANNLAAAFLDNSLFKGNPLDINPESITLRRTVDVSDRFLRSIRIGLGGKDDGCQRDSGFDITVASEVMAILALASGLPDLRKRLGRMTVAEDSNGRPITLEDLKVAGSMCALLKDAIKPNLIQTLEHTPVIVHAGPFGNIAHGNSSILADEIALRLGDFVVTEAGFGADLGLEKFFDIKCRYSGLKPNAVVMVCTVRALKMHSGRFKVVAGKPLDKGLVSEDLSAIEAGICNLEKQIENVRLFGLPCIVAINRFKADTDREIALVREKAIAAGAKDCLVSEVWARGGRGAIGLARAVVRAANEKNNFKFLYSLKMPIKDKIRAIATQVYGAKDVFYEPLAEEKLARYTERGYGGLPICMAKTHLSLSHDPNLKGRPRGFLLPIRDVLASVGAGFIYPLCGKMQTMPGLPSEPAGKKIDIDKKGNIVGLA